MDAEALNKNAGIVVLFRAFVIEERAPTVGTLGEDGLKMRCKIGMLLRACPLGLIARPGDSMAALKFLAIIRLSNQKSAPVWRDDILRQPASVFCF
ncbi:MAG: hypothetical protein GXP18_13655 [Gammaproteobacteria bacterium]|nr:hypothetical protein [Gammaproteobacteria bacterium]